MKYRTYVLLLLSGAVIVLEILIRCTGKFDTYAESIGQRYSSYYNVVLPQWYHSWMPNDSFELDHGDFKFLYKTNGFGMREVDFSKQKPDSTFRIITLGDSYTEGVGAPYDSSWPRLLTKHLKGIRGVEVINAGQSGSDPFYDYVFYRDRLSDYDADLVIASLNSSDFTDYVLRGGMERFHSDSTTHFRKGPWYEPIYKYSHLFRVVINKVLRFPHRGIFVTQSEMLDETAKASLEYTNLFSAMNNIAAKRSTKLIVLVYPTPTEIRYSNSTNEHSRAVMEQMCADLSKRDVSSINMWNDFGKMFAAMDEAEYTYNHDKHFTPKGYDIMSELVAEKVDRIIVEAEHK